MRYSEPILMHFENPKNVGVLDVCAEGVGTGKVGTRTSGDVVQLQIKVDDNIIRDAKFKCYGSAPAIAACSLVTEWLKNKTLHQAAKINSAQIVKSLDLPKVKVHCALLVEDAVQAAIHDIQSKEK